MKRIYIFGMVLFALMACISSAAALDDTVTRSLPDSADAGTSITVDITVDVETGATFYTIDETVPPGWTVISATGGGDYTAETGHVKWILFSGVADIVYSYTVGIPADASGEYTFDGIYMFEGMTDSTDILGDTVMTVNPAPPPEIVINEFVSDNDTEWVELYNNGTDPVDLVGWTLEDGGSHVKDLSETIPADSYMVFNYSSGWLNNLGDIIYLNSTTANVDTVAYGDWDDGNASDNAPKPAAGKSAGRYPNGVDNDNDSVDFREFDIPTPGAENCVMTTYYGDADGDGYGDPDDSVEADSAPAGYVENADDCDDTDPNVNPGETEVCGNGIDDNCDGNIDEGCGTYYRDADGDTYGNASDSVEADSAPAGYVENADDCDDTDPNVNPGETEVCGNEIDDNCDGQIDEGCNMYYRDADEDGYGDPDDSIEADSAPEGYVEDNTDCDDNNAEVNPGATEVCGNGIDDNCDGQVDEGCGIVTITDWTIDATAARGTPIYATVNITNTGDESLCFVVSVSGAEGTTGYPLVGLGTVEVAAGKSINVPVLIAVPGSTDTGAYTLIPVVYLADEYPAGDPEVIGSGESVTIS